jgi:hypothetical protein
MHSKDTGQFYKARMQIPYVVHSRLANFYFVLIIILSSTVDIRGKKSMVK